MSELHHEAQEAVDEAKLSLLVYERADSSMLYRARAEILDALDTQERQSMAGNGDLSPHCSLKSFLYEQVNAYLPEAYYYFTNKRSAVM